MNLSPGSAPLPEGNAANPFAVHRSSVVKVRSGFVAGGRRLALPDAETVALLRRRPGWIPRGPWGLVEPRRLELPTSALQRRRSPS